MAKSAVFLVSACLQSSAEHCVSDPSTLRTVAFWPEGVCITVSVWGRHAARFWATFQMPIQNCLVLSFGSRYEPGKINNSCSNTNGLWYGEDLPVHSFFTNFSSKHQKDSYDRQIQARFLFLAEPQYWSIPGASVENVHIFIQAKTCPVILSLL